MNKNNFLNWSWRIIKFPLVLIAWIVGCLITGIITAVDWLIHPNLWEGFDKKEEK